MLKWLKKYIIVLTVLCIAVVAFAEIIRYNNVLLNGEKIYISLRDVLIALIPIVVTTLNNIAVGIYAKKTGRQIPAIIGAGICTIITTFVAFTIVLDYVTVRQTDIKCYEEIRNEQMTSDCAVLLPKSIPRPLGRSRMRFDSVTNNYKLGKYMLLSCKLSNSAYVTEKLRVSLIAEEVNSAGEKLGSNNAYVVRSSEEGADDFAKAYFFDRKNTVVYVYKEEEVGYLNMDNELSDFIEN